MPIFGVTPQALRHQISRAFGDLVATSGSLASPTTSTMDTPVLIAGTNNQIVGGQVSFYAGGGASIAQGSRVITAFTPFSLPGGAARITILQPWAVAPSTNSGWEIHKLFSREQYDDAIARSVRGVARRILLPAEDYSIVLNSRVRNGTFDRWAAGLTSAPTGWTAGGAGTVAQEQAGDIGEHTYQGRYAMAMTNTGSNAYSFQQAVRNWAASAGENLEVRVIAFAQVGSRFRIRYTDGVNTWDSDYHNGEGWQELSIDQAITALPTDGTISVRIETGGAITVRVAKVTVKFGDTIYEYPLEEEFAWIQDIYLEGGTDGVFDERVPREWWYLLKDRSPRHIGFLKPYYTPVTGKVVRVVGQRYPSAPSEEVNLSVDPEYVFAKASLLLYEQLPKGSADWKGWDQQTVEWRNAAERMERKAMTRPYQGSRSVEDV